MRFFRNIAKEKEFIDREIELYKKEKTLEADKELENNRIRLRYEIVQLETSCARDTAKFEHSFHSTKEKKEAELAGLTARLEATTELISCRREIAMADENLIKEQKAEIIRLNNIIELLIKNQPKTSIQNLTHGH